MLRSATFLCWPYKQLRTLTSQHPRGQGPKSILEPGYHLTREEVPACPQAGTSNSQVWGSSPHTTAPSSFAPSVLGKPRTTQILPSHPPNLPSPSTLGDLRPTKGQQPYRLVPSWGLASSHTHSSLDSQQGVAEPPSFYRNTGRERACKPHSQGREHLWLPSELRPIGGAGTGVESGRFCKAEDVEGLIVFLFRGQESLKRGGVTCQPAQRWVLKVLCVRGRCNPVVS